MLCSFSSSSHQKWYCIAVLVCDAVLTIVAFTQEEWIATVMGRSATVNHDQLKQNTVNFNSIDKDYIVRWQSDIENTQERPLHKPSQDQTNLPHWAEFEIFRNGALCLSVWRYNKCEDTSCGFKLCSDK